MSYDTNYISPNHNAEQLDPLPETVSDERYIEARKELEQEMCADLDYLRYDVLIESMSDEFIRNFSEYLKTGTGGVQSLMLLTTACKAYIEEKAKQEIDDRGDEI